MIYLAGGWIETGPRNNDIYFLVEAAYLSRRKALGSDCETIFAAKPGAPMIDWEDITQERETTP